MIKIYSKLLALCVFLTNFWGTTAFFVPASKTQSSVALSSVLAPSYEGSRNSYPSIDGYGGSYSGYQYGSPYRGIRSPSDYYYDGYHRGYGGYGGTFSIPADGYRHNDYMMYNGYGYNGYGHNGYGYNGYSDYGYGRGGYRYW